MPLFKKFPNFKQSAPVYAVIVTLLYGWSLIQFFWKLPTWLTYSTLGEIAVIFSYMIFTVFLDSLLVFLVLVLLSIFLPKQYFLEQFVVKGSSVVILGLVFVILYFGDIISWALSLKVLALRLFALGVGLVAISFLVNAISVLKKLVSGFANRAVIFLYIWMPITALSVLTVILRNIF